ncbi:uncharacterized protein LTR77_005860 [Saxophila tyrrhenica]|uniref:F-box domain-containing protein n=1 Tax=Saxophila tyrrhenica TaxID=1690608 RepID=A0AAV9PCT0_9PEZI|nr:hypothetical protein LTR77_005860 [Saxophila tyrrhenica]
MAPQPAEAVAALLRTVEIVETIVAFLPTVQDIVRTSAVCRQLNAIITQTRSQTIRQRLFFAPMPPPQEDPGDLSYAEEAERLRCPMGSLLTIWNFDYQYAALNPLLRPCFVNDRSRVVLFRVNVARLSRMIEIDERWKDTFISQPPRLFAGRVLDGVTRYTNLSYQTIGGLVEGCEMLAQEVLLLTGADLLLNNVFVSVADAFIPSY